jgi:hypothetical protein
MTDNTPAGEKPPHANAQPAATATATKIKVGSVAGFLAVIPHLVGFHPSRSMVVVGLDARKGRILLAFRYDLPDPPGRTQTRDIALHVIGVLKKRKIKTVIAAGYGPGPLVTPVAEAILAAARSARIAVRDMLRVEDGRYFSYLCRDPQCCPPGGIPFDGAAHPAAAAMAAAGLSVCPDRASLAALLAPLAGPAADSMARATQRALRRARDLRAVPARPGGSGGPGGSGRSREAGRPRPLTDAGRAAVREAIAVYRSGGHITDHDQMAWLTVTLADIRVRDDAWARMDPVYRLAHRKLWIDVVRHACEAYVPAPASLLAFTAWQSGEGALGNIAIDRALAADPDYSMAHLLGQALDAGLPPSAARLPMTPEEVEAAYAVTDPLGVTGVPGETDPGGPGEAVAGAAGAREPGAASGAASARLSPGRSAGSTTRPASRRPAG